MKKIALFIIFLTISKASIYDVSIPENDTASYNYADFRIWINDSTDILRGIYWFMHPNNGDSRNIVNDSVYQTLVNEQDFALMGAHIFNMNMETGIGDAVIAAMDSFAVLSGHNEISYIPFFINGYSWGGQFGYHFTKWIPERTIGFITQKGGYHDTTDAGDAIQVPGLMFVGENDLPYRIENLTGIFLDHRPLGAKWALAMEQGAGHSLILDYPFLNSFFNTVVNLRLPQNLNVFEPIVLNTLPDTIGWLGNQEIWRIGSWECYDGNPNISSWFLSRTVGEYWQTFVSDSTTNDTSDCNPVFDSSYVFFTVGIHGENDESNYVVTTNNNDLINQCRSQLDLPEEERILHINGYLGYGDEGFNNPWNWHIIPNNWVLAEMSIGLCNGLPLDVENDLDYWINTVGQLCNWGSYIKDEIDLNQGLDSSVVSIIYEFESFHETNISDSIFFSFSNISDSIDISYDSIDFVSGSAAMDVTFSFGSNNPNQGNWAGLNFTNLDSSRMDFSIGDTLSFMLKVENPPNFPEYMSIRFLIADKPVFYGFDEIWAGDDSILIDQESDWKEVKIPLKPHRWNSLYPIIGSDIDNGFNISPYWWDLQYNNWKLDLDRVSRFSIFVGTNAYDSNVSILPEDEVTISLDYMTIKDSSNFEHIYDFHDQLDIICMSPQNQRQELIEDITSSLSAIPYIEIRENIIGDFEGIDAYEHDFAMTYFLYFSQNNNDVVTVNGSWNDWNGSLWNMSNIPGTDFWFRSMIMPHHGRFNYTYWADGTYYDDPMNDITCMAWNFGITDQVSGPDYHIPPEWSYNDTISHGTFFDTTFYSTAMENSRNISVYLPPNYEYSSNHYPVVIYHDGDRILPRDPQNIIDNLIHANRINSIIAIFIPPVNRTAEYRTYYQEDYTNFIIDDILEWAKNKYRILDDPENIASIGFSNGGCIAVYQGITRYDVFGKIGAFAPTINSNYNQIIQNFGESLPDLDIYMEGYWYDNLLWQGLAFRDTLMENGFNVTWNDFPDGHELCAVMGNQDLLLEHFFGIEELNIQVQSELLPSKIKLNLPYPNPFNPITTISFEILSNTMESVEIRIYDISGRILKTIINNKLKTGHHQIQWNASSYSSGVYFIELVAKDFKSVKKLILLK